MVDNADLNATCWIDTVGQLFYKGYVRERRFKSRTFTDVGQSGKAKRLQNLRIGGKEIPTAWEKGHGY